MKRLILVVLSGAVLAGCDKSDIGQASVDSKDCAVFAALAHNIMDGRQKGVSMKESMEISERSKLPDNLKAVVKSIVISAYERPRYSTEQMKAREVTEFENGYYLACSKA